MSLHPAVAAVRLAVRRALTDVRDRPVLVACSGGADSLALLAATVFEGRKAGWHVVGVTVDHGLQKSSADHADRVVAQMAGLGADETVSVAVTVDARGQGVEAAAREARYAVLTEITERMAAAVALLGHTLDDQAETVLLGLTRGSGGRSIAGMRPGFGPFRRPLLEVTRAQTEAACAAEGIEFWEDPHNTDPRFTRARIRHAVLPVLEEQLGPGVAEALARTAEMLRSDLEYLDDEAESLLEAHLVGESRAAPGQEPAAAGAGAGAGRGSDDSGLEVSWLGALPDALRHRVLRLAALRAGAPASELFRVHVLAIDALVTDYRGQQWVDLPGHIRGVREQGRLHFRRSQAGVDRS